MKALRIPRSSRRQAGDTIVEVLIALTVVSAILAGAFVVTSRSVRDVRDSEEHAQALNLLQGQVESLRSSASMPGAITSCDTATGSLPCDLLTPFCVDAGGHYPAGDAHCTVDTLYRIAVTSPTAAASSTDTTTFDLTATWDALSGGTDQVGLSYKLKVAQ